MKPNEESNNTETCEARLLDLHIAEYNALTNRETYWIAIQYSLAPVFLVCVSIVADRWTPSHADSLIWIMALLGQALAFLWTQTLGEIYKVIIYLEQRLRPAIRKLAPEGSFWQYEQYTSEERNHFAVWWEYFFPALALVAVIGLAVWLQPSSRFDRVACCLNAVLVLVLFLKSAENIRLRRSIFTLQGENPPAARASGNE